MTEEHVLLSSISLCMIMQHQLKREHGRHRRRAGHLDADRQHRAQQLQDLAPAQALSGGSVCARCGAAAQQAKLSGRLGLHHF